LCPKNPDTTTSHGGIDKDSDFRGQNTGEDWSWYYIRIGLTL